MNFISNSFGVTTTVAFSIAGWVLYLVKLSTWQRVAVVAGAGAFAVILGAILSIGIDYLVRKYSNRSMLTTW